MLQISSGEERFYGTLQFRMDCGRWRPDRWQRVPDWQAQHLKCAMHAFRELLALGADAVMIGRAALYGTAAAGEAGATHVLDLLRSEMLAAQGFLGCASLRELDPSFVNLPSWSGRERSAAFPEA